MGTGYRSWEPASERAVSGQECGSHTPTHARTPAPTPVIVTYVHHRLGPALVPRVIGADPEKNGTGFECRTRF